MTHGLWHALRAFEQRNFAVFWAGALCANLGGWMQNLAIPYVLFQQTDSAAWVGLAGAVQFLPGMALGPLGGVIAERYNLRRVLLVTQAARALVALALFVITAFGWSTPPLLLMLALLAGAALGIQMPSWQSLIYHLVSRENLTSAVTLNTAQFVLARSFGPVLAGGALLMWGVSLVFFAAFVAILIVIVALSFIRFRQPEHTSALAVPGVRSPGVLRDFGKSLSYIRTQPGLVVSLSIMLLMGLLGMPIFQHVIVFSQKVFGSDRSGLVLLSLGLGLGTMIAVPLVSGFEHRVSRAALVMWSLPMFTLSLALFAIMPSIAMGFLALMLVGAFYLCTHAVSQNAVQIIVAPAMRGRVLALQVMISGGATALGCYLQGVMVDFIGPRYAVLLAAALFMLCAAVLILQRGQRWLRCMNDSRVD